MSVCLFRGKRLIRAVDGDAMIGMRQWRCIYTRAATLVYARGGVMSPWVCGSRGGCVSAEDEVVRKAREMNGAAVRDRAPGRRCGWNAQAGGRDREDAVGWTQGQGGCIDLEATREHARLTQDMQICCRCRSRSPAGGGVIS
jgi:hypothetical protein